MKERELIAKFIEDSRPKFNPFFFQRDDDEIIKELKNVILSCQRDNEYFSIRVKSFETVDDYDEINRILFEYYEQLTKNKSKAKKRDNQYGYINLNKSYIRLLIVNYLIKDKMSEEEELRVIIAVPRIVDKFYFCINGILRSTLFQIVDGSTYNNGTSNAKVPSITLKIIFMATRVTRYYQNIETTAGEQLRISYYHSRIFNKGVSGVKYILAKFGLNKGLDFLGLSGYVHITKKDPADTTLYTFRVRDGLFVSAPKILMDKVPLLQTTVYTLMTSLFDGIDFNEYFTKDYWVRVLGMEFSGGGADRIRSIYDPEDKTAVDTLEKGYNILESFESIYDISTRESIKLPESEKATTYHILRWIMREFNALRIKDNLDVRCKKIRFAEYIASMYAMKIARGIYRVSDMHKRATVQGIRKAIKTDPNYLLSIITKSKMVSYRNMVSDMDSMQALKFTYKGVSGLGEKSNQSIPDIYRSIHPSHVGKVDLDASSDGNPGITGTICPYAPVYDGFFEDYQEPNTWEQEFVQTVDEYKKAIGLKDALIFEQSTLGRDNTEEINQTSEIIATMKQIITPIGYANEGEEVPIEEAFRNG